MSVKPIPEGFHTLTPHIILKNASEAIEFYKKAFGAEEIFRMPTPDGKIGHAELKIGDSMLMLCDEYPEMGCLSPQTIGNTPVTLSLYVENADDAFNTAVAAGATVKMPLADQFWGDRYGQVTDPYGHCWSICTHIKDMTPEEIAQASAEAFSKGDCGQAAQA
ncbi:MAG: VOC family protein [Blastocatellia bacterium]|jgi:uncharacterized glyoxalase superfamily protein PhnB